MHRHPAFPTPFSGKGGNFSHNSGAFAPRVKGLLRQTQTVCACERRRMSLAVSSPAKAGDPVLQRKLMIISKGRGVLDTRFRGYDGGAYDQRDLFAHASAGECHSPCHRPRRRAIQYCRGADDHSTGRGVLDTRFRGYDRAGPKTNATCLRMRAQANVTRRVIAREGGRSSIAEELMIIREAAAYWIPAFAGMTAGPTTNATCLRMGGQ